MASDQSKKEIRHWMLVDTLRKTPMFSGLGQALLDDIAGGCHLRSYKKGESLFHENEHAAGFFIVHTGAINVHRITEDGREQVIRVFYPGESFGEVVLVGNTAFPASAKAAEASQVIIFPTAFFREKVRENPDLALSILGSMSLHLRYLVEMVEDLKLNQAQSRVVQWLLRQLDESGEAANTTRTVLHLPLAKHLLASQLGITSETLSRVFAHLRSLDLVAIDGREVTFISVAGLRELLLQAG